MALLKDLIVQGAARVIGDAYFAAIKAGVWNGTPIDLSHGGTAGETTAGKILTSTTTSGTSAWLSIILGNCMTISTTNSNITVGVSDTYKSIMDYYARTAYYTSPLTISPTTYDKGASSVSVTVTLTPKKEAATYATTSADTATYGITTSMGTAMTRNTNTFTATYTFTPNSSSGNITFYGQANLGGVTLTRQSAKLTMQQKVYYGKLKFKPPRTEEDDAIPNTDLLPTVSTIQTLSYVLASSKGSTVTAPAGNGIPSGNDAEYWWFVTPFVNSSGTLKNVPTNETSGVLYQGQLTMNNSTYYIWGTTSIAASQNQNWIIGLLES